MPKIEDMQRAKLQAEWEARPNVPVLGVGPEPKISNGKTSLTDAWGIHWTSIPNHAILLEPVLGPQGTRLYVALCRYLKPHKGKFVANVSERRLSGDTGMGRQSIRSAANWLQATGMLMVDRERRPHQYRLLPFNEDTVMRWEGIQILLGWDGNPVSWATRRKLPKKEVPPTGRQVRLRGRLEHFRAGI